MIVAEQADTDFALRISKGTRGEFSRTESRRCRQRPSFGASHDGADNGPVSGRWPDNISTAVRLEDWGMLAAHAAQWSVYRDSNLVKVMVADMS